MSSAFTRKSTEPSKNSAMGGECTAEPALAPDRGRITVSRDTMFHQRPRQVKGVVRRERWKLQGVSLEQMHMTEAEWLACTDPFPMLAHVREGATFRKRQLYCLACWHEIRPLLTDHRSVQALALLERFADHDWLIWLSAGGRPRGRVGNILTLTLRFRALWRGDSGTGGWPTTMSSYTTPWPRERKQRSRVGTQGPFSRGQLLRSSK